ncbi:putative kinase domain protein [Rhizoctonia solani 123E]|uniref:Putative kinase domain protein n=1 Tax=Rhizoctonia solani 123E TaxID=1423351 RepID=A0A074RJU8_9AGAM|nr:putative kinase domain protein [Rhizoctonia solani 123E]
MHRDISDGNVLMLDVEKAFSRKEWLESRVAHSRIQEAALIESEAKLRSIIEEIGHRDPTGMLSDFDLYAIHSSVSEPITTTTTVSPVTTEPTTSRSSRRRFEEDAPLESASKKRKTNSYTTAPVASAPTEGQDRSEESSPQTLSQLDKRKLIDFRTGTPAFMSISVLAVKAGMRYHHHYFDDLESFFWLMLWSVCAHLDDGKRHPSPRAQDLLNELNRGELYPMSVSKMGLLTIFMDMERAEDTLAEYANEWALDPMFLQVLTGMSSLLFRFTSTSGRKRAEGSPGTIFGKVVRIFLDALGPE